MLLRATSLLLLGASIGLNSVNGLDVDMKRFPDCECEDYLKYKGWAYLKQWGLQFPDFCCQISFAQQCIERYSYYPKLASLSGDAGSGVSADGYSGGSLTAYCVKYAGLDALAYRYPDKHKQYINGGKEAQYGGEEGEDEAKIGAESYGYKNPCYYAKNYYGYVGCVFEEYFKEALHACHCYYRSGMATMDRMGCTDEDCDKEIYTDLYIAYGDPQTVCNQCPDPPHGTGGGGAYTPKPYGGGGNKQDGYDAYKSYLSGMPYDECTGYCVLTAYFRHYKYPYYYSGKAGPYVEGLP